jgi:hypothetical protein
MAGSEDRAALPAFAARISERWRNENLQPVFFRPAQFSIGLDEMALVLKHPEVIAYLQGDTVACIAVRRGRAGAGSQAYWQALAGRCALRICEIEEASISLARQAPT